MTDTDIAERDAMLAAITTAWEHSQTPADLRDACLAFVAGQVRTVQYLRGIMLLTIGCFIEDLETDGHDRRMLEQVVAAETQRCIAMMMRAACERDGRDYVPARQAIVGYFHALGVATADPFECDLPGAVAEFRRGEAAEKETA